MVEVGGALGPSFEAQAVNLSEEGMSLRTAYLPEVGQPVMCRFDAGQGMPIAAAGEVVWRDDMGDGGEFGIRFTNLDAPSTVALQRILGMGEDGQATSMEPGRKVRLHIEGLASPMRARVRDQQTSGLTAYSELGFLQMGKPLDLEDAQSGHRRPAMIDRVEVAVDDASRIPQLIVSLRYDDPHAAAAEAHDMSEQDGGKTPHDPSMEEEEAGDAAQAAPAEAPPEPKLLASIDDAEETGGGKLKKVFSRGAAKVGPAISSWAKRAKVTAALLAARARGGSGDDVEVPVRRTTAPAPGGGLHAEGRKVVRGSVPDDRFGPLEEEPPPGRFKMTKKKAAIASAIGIAGVLVFFAVRKPAPAPQLAAVPPPDAPAASATIASATTDAPAAKPVAPPADPLAAAAAAMASKPGKAMPFTNGPVGAHPTVIKIKMDGNIDGIQGAAQPTGFTVVIPNRKSIEPTAALADKDQRIASIGVSNEAQGAEFSVAFKDGVPNYLVRAHGDTLEMVLAHGTHADKAEAKATKKKPHGKKH
jgi:hypothetical protein